MSGLSSGLIPLGNSSTNRAGSLASLGPLAEVSPGKGGKAAYVSTNWDEDLDDLLNSIDSSPDKKKKGKAKGKKSSVNNKKYSSRAMDESNDSLFESSDNFSSYPKRGQKDNFELSVASDLGSVSPDHKGADLLGDMVTSKDLDDSILGGLVGGFKRPASKPVAKPAPEVQKTAPPVPVTTEGSSRYGTQPSASSRAVNVPVKSTKTDDNFDSSDNSFDDQNIAVRSSTSPGKTSNATGGYNPSISSRATTAAKPALGIQKSKNFDESDSFDDANLPIFGDNSSLPNTTGPPDSSRRGRPSAIATAPVAPAKGNKYNFDESESFDDTNLPIFEKDQRPSTGQTAGGSVTANARKSRSPSPRMPSPAKGALEESSSFDDSNLPIFGGPVGRSNSGPLADRVKVVSPAGTKKEQLSLARAAAAEENNESADSANKSSMPFIPSFYDAKPRSRRNLGADSAPVAKAKVDELDKLIGVGSGGSVVSNLINKDAIKDPFSASSKPESILPPSIANISRAQSLARFSDSSDSEVEVKAGKDKQTTVIGTDAGRPKTADAHHIAGTAADGRKKGITASGASDGVVAAMAEIPKSDTEIRPQTAPLPRPSVVPSLGIDPESPQKSSLKSSTRLRSPGGNEKTILTSPESKQQQFARFAAGADLDDRMLDTESSMDRRHPAWLGGGTPGGNSTTSTSRLGTPQDREGRGGADSANQDKLYRTMQQRLEQIQLEKEAVERNLRLEIDQLKTGLLHRQGSGELFYRGTSFGGGTMSNDAAVESNSQLVNDLKNEISKLKDELAIQAGRHAETVKEEKERSQRNIEGAENKRRDDIRVIEMRHEEAVSALKRMHAEEVSAIKQRARDGVALEELSSQIRTTTGSLRLIEEHMNSQYKGLDIVKEGQFEARERLLAAAEEKSRERAELAEAEGYRLKGILVHMEQMVASLRSQGSEERERLKYEHRRLEMAQSSLDQERKAHQGRMHDETDELKKKSAAFKEELRLKEAEFFEKKRNLEDAVCKLDTEKEEFRNHVTHSLKQTEDGLKRLKEEEAKLVRTREELRREAAKLKEERAAAVNDLLRADEFYAQIEQDRQQIASDKAALEETARRVQEVSEELENAGTDVERRSESLAERELVLERGLREMHQSSGVLVKREFDVVHSSKAIETKQLALKQAEDNAIFQRISAAAIHREALHLRNTALPTERAIQGLIRGGLGTDRAGGGSLPARQTQLPPPPPTSAYSQEGAEIEKELKNIQRSIRNSKFSSSKNSNARAATFGFLAEEVNYITNNTSTFVAKESYY